MALQQGLNVLASLIQQGAADKRRMEDKAFRYMMTEESREYQELKKTRSDFADDAETDFGIENVQQSVGRVPDDFNAYTSEQREEWKEGQKASMTTKLQTKLIGRAELEGISDKYSSKVLKIYNDKLETNVNDAVEFQVAVADLTQYKEKLTRINREDASEGYMKLIEKIEANKFSDVQQGFGKIQKAKAEMINLVKGYSSMYDWMDKTTEKLKDPKYNTPMAGIKLMEIKNLIESDDIKGAQQLSRQFWEPWPKTTGGDLPGIGYDYALESAVEGYQQLHKSAQEHKQYGEGINYSALGLGDDSFDAKKLYKYPQYRAEAALQTKSSYDNASSLVGEFISNLTSGVWESEETENIVRNIEAGNHQAAIDALQDPEKRSISAYRDAYVEGDVYKEELAVVSRLSYLLQGMSKLEGIYKGLTKKNLTSKIEIRKKEQEEAKAKGLSENTKRWKATGSRGMPSDEDLKKFNKEAKEKNAKAEKEAKEKEKERLKNRTQKQKALEEGFTGK